MYALITFIGKPLTSRSKLVHIEKAKDAPIGFDFERYLVVFWGGLVDDYLI